MHEDIIWLHFLCVMLGVVMLVIGLALRDFGAPPWVAIAFFAPPLLCLWIAMVLA